MSTVDLPDVKLNDPNGVAHSVRGLTVVISSYFGGLPPHFEEISRLRHKCWKPHSSGFVNMDDEHDRHATHWLVTVGDEVVAAARLCVHTDISSVPDSHIFAALNPFDVPSPIGCVNRLVVSFSMRGAGIPLLLDQLRETDARNRGCKSMLLNFNPASGVNRRKAILAWRFKSVSNDVPVSDGDLGVSFPYCKLLSSDPIVPECRESSEPFIPIFVNDKELMLKIGHLRVRAWKARGELSRFATDPSVWLDDHDDHATNWAIIHEGQPIAAARFCVHDRVEDLPDAQLIERFKKYFIAPIGSLNRLVVAPEFSGRGLVRLLDEVRMAMAIQRKCESIIGTSHHAARIADLEALGFVRLGVSSCSPVSNADSYVLMKKLEAIPLDT